MSGWEEIKSVGKEDLVSLENNIRRILFRQHQEQLQAIQDIRASMLNEIKTLRETIDAQNERIESVRAAVVKEIQETQEGESKRINLCIFEALKNDNKTYPNEKVRKHYRKIRSQEPTPYMVTEKAGLPN